MTYPPPHSPHFVRPENRYFGRRAWLNRCGSPFDATRRIVDLPRLHLAPQLVVHDAQLRHVGRDPLPTDGFGRETRLPVSGSFTYRSRFHTRRPT